MDPKSYILTFQRVMKERARLLEDDLRKKRQLDKKPLEQFSAQDAQALTALVGTDTFFSSGKKRNQQTIRHQLWKFRKSIEMFSKHQAEYYQQLVRADYKGTIVGTLSPAAAAEAHVFMSELDDLERIYDRQVFILSNHRIGQPIRPEIWRTYQSLVADEQAVWQKLGGRSNSVNYLLVELKTELQRSYDEAKRAKVGPLELLKNTCLIAILMTGTTVGLLSSLIGGLMNNNGQASDDPIALLILLVGLMTAVTAMAGFETVNTAPFKNAWDRLLSMFKDAAKESAN